MGCIIKGKKLIDYKEDGNYIVVIPNGVEKIDDRIFKDCQSIVEVVIPNSVKVIGNEAFRNCRNLRSVKFEGEVEKIGNLCFYGCCNLIHIESKEGKTANDVEQFFERLKNGELTLEEGKELYDFSKTKGIVKIKEFKGVYMKLNDNIYRYTYHFRGKENYLYFPKKIGGMNVEKIPCKQIPEDSIVYCDETYFQKLPRLAKASTVVQWFQNDRMIFDNIKDEMLAFIKKYSDAVVYSLRNANDVSAYSRFFEIVSPKANLIDSMIENAKDNPEISAFLLSKKSNVKTSLEEEFSLEPSKPLTVAELKKIWTYTVYTWAETNEKFIEISTYKGQESNVVVPDVIGKVKVKRVNVDFPPCVKSVTFENPEVENTCSFHRCEHMADKNGFIILNIGNNNVLTNYIGNKKTIKIPEGVTYNLKDAFKECDITKITFPNGFKKITKSSFYGCSTLRTVELPDTLEEIEMFAFSYCNSLKEIYVPSSVKVIGHHAFEEGTIIHCEKDSYACEYAKKYNYKVVLK